MLTGSPLASSRLLVRERERVKVGDARELLASRGDKVAATARPADGEAACVGTPATLAASSRTNMSAQAQMRAMLDQLMGTGRDGEEWKGGLERATCSRHACMLLVRLAGKLTR